jgi:hypothetical protein
MGILAYPLDQMAGELAGMRHIAMILKRLHYEDADCYQLHMECPRKRDDVSAAWALANLCGFLTIP